MIDESEIVIELPDGDTSFMSNASEEENNFSVFANESQLVEDTSRDVSESSSSESSSNLPRRKPTWNDGAGFKRHFTNFNGKAPDYRCSYKLPVEYFYRFCNRSMIGKITCATNLYAAQNEYALNVSC